MNQRYDVCIIGGGAAGLAAAASIDRRIRTCIIEKNQILGRKILATGGGRCNLTNAGCEGVSATLDFFASLGLETICDNEGRYYPYSGCATDVVKVLETVIREKGVDVFTDHAVERIERAREVKPGERAEEVGVFRIHSTTHWEDPKAQMSLHTDGIKKVAGDMIEAKTLLLAIGGKAAPQFGTVGDGYRFARQLGHHVSRVYPILTGIETGEGRGFKDLKGIRARGRASLWKDGRQIAEEVGEIQFLEDGLSGICIFNLTPHIRAEHGEKPPEAFARYRVVLDLAPDFTREQIDARAAAGRSSFGILNDRLAAVVGLDRIKGWSLPIRGVKGWKNAQCTAGGVLRKEVDLSTMESRLVPGLYLAGELLDIQGPCGGYNLQNAWETGMRAAAAVNAVFLGPDGRSNQ